MISCIAILTLAVVAINANTLNIKDCDNLPVSVISVTTDNGKSALSKDSVLTASYDIGMDVAAGDEIKVYLEISKKVLWWYVPIPGFIIDQLGAKNKDPNVKYLGKSVFQLGCPVLKRYLQCPPVQGKHAEKIVLKEAFEKIKAIGKIGSFAASGWVKVHVKGSRASDNKKMVCIDLEVELDL